MGQYKWPSHGIEQIAMKLIKHAMTVNHKHIDTPDHTSHKLHITTALTH